MSRPLKSLSGAPCDRCCQRGAATATTDAATVGVAAAVVRRGARTMRTRLTYTRTRELERCGRGRLRRIQGCRRLNLYNRPLNSFYVSVYMTIVRSVCSGLLILNADPSWRFGVQRHSLPPYNLYVVTYGEEEPISSLVGFPWFLASGGSRLVGRCLLIDHAQHD